MSGPFTDDSLPLLKRQFAREVKRNLFEAYLQPRRINISLVSTSTTSSAACPGGEAFEFVFSPNGHWVLALSSSRIYVIDTVSPKISIQRELKVLRRPVSAAILDDGSILAVLSSDHKVNVYDLTNLKAMHLRSVSLDNAPHVIALAPKGEVLAAAFDGGIEVHSLAKDVGAMDHRAIKSDRVDSLRFSNDGTMLLGTTRNSKDPNTVILSAPYSTDDHQEMPAADQISHLWTTQILFPNSSRDCSNATLLPNRSDGDVNWTFTYDKVFESFRAVRTDDLRNGTTYFTGPKPPGREGPRHTRKKLVPCTLPSSSSHGELVAAGFLGKDVWLYGVPEGLETAPVSQTDDPNSQGGSSAGSSTPSTGARSPAKSFTRGENAQLAKLPKWQVLVDKYRNVFARGRKVADISGVSAVCWVSHYGEGQESLSLKERLIIAAPGGLPGDPELEQDGFASVDGGRLLILDFDRTTGNGETEDVAFEVGNDTPELLEEENMDMETEVALARRRTIKRDPSKRLTVIDALASAPRLPSIPPMPGVAPTANAIANANATSVARGLPTRTGGDGSISQTEAAAIPLPEEGLSIEEAAEAFDGPYSQMQPRSRTSLYQSATAVAANRERYPQRPRIVDEAAPRFRRPGDRTELPHESDADHWVPPPPPYAPKAERPLPEELRITLLPRTTELNRTEASRRTGPRRATTMYDQIPANSSTRRVTPLSDRPGRSVRHNSSDAAFPGPRIHRRVSDSVSPSSGGVSPLRTDFSFGDELSEPSIASRRPSTLSSSRRPMSAVIGRVAPSFRRPNAARLTSPISPDSQPPMPIRRAVTQSVSLPPSPTRGPRNERPRSPLTLTGANLQQRLEYPLPPAPTNSSVESLNRRYNVQPPPSIPVRSSEPSAYQEHQRNILATSSNMPSAQQRTNLHNRSRQAPAPRINPPNLHNDQGYPIPAPPRGALGAAGSPSSSPMHSPSRSLSQRNVFARSSPALLRPAPRRLDTIDSVSSFISRSRTRSASRPHTAERRPSSSGLQAHQNLGPTLRLDRASTDPFQKKSLFGKSKRGKRQKAVTDGVNLEGNGKGGKCIIM